MPPVPDIASRDWSDFGSAIMYVLVGAGTAVVALWRKRQRGPTPPPPPPQDATMLVASTLSTLRDAEEAIRSLRDSNLDTQTSLASQLGALRGLVEELQTSTRMLRRLIAKIEGERSKE